MATDVDIHKALKRAGFLVRRFEKRLKTAKTDAEAAFAIGRLRAGLNRLRVRVR